MYLNIKISKSFPNYFFKIVYFRTKKRMSSKNILFWKYKMIPNTHEGNFNHQLYGKKCKFVGNFLYLI